MEKSAAATLPEDVVLEILARVTDPIDLFRCGTACRRWCALVADPSFLNRRWPENAPAGMSYLLGFFVQLRRSAGERIEGILSFLPPPASPLGPPHRFFRSDFPVLNGGGGGDFSDRVTVPLASRRGQLLVRLLPRGGPERGIVQLAVYDMFAGACHVLPQLECEDGSSYIACSALLTSADIQEKQQQKTPSSSSLPYRSSFFAVIVIGTAHLRRYYLHSFSSGDASWSRPIQCCNRTIAEQRVVTMQMPRGTVVCQGSAHWLFLDMSNFYTLSVSLDTKQVVSLVKVPLSVPPNTYAASRLCVGTDGTLTLLALRKSLQLEIWTQEPQIFDGSTRWLCTQVIDIEKPKQSQITTVMWMYPGEKIGSSLMLANYWGTFMVDLETKTCAEEVTGQISNLEYTKSVPLDMDWPTFFTSRLSKLCTSCQN
jgi:hypothetical protein